MNRIKSGLTLFEIRVTEPMVSDHAGFADERLNFIMMVQLKRLQDRSGS
jgi:hypothetical protein